MTARYERIADAYARRPDDYSGSATAALLDLLGPLAGRRALDLACGHGTIARALADRGAHVVGLDVCLPLLASARALTPGAGVAYVHADAAMPALRDGVFDLAACHFGLSDIDDLGAVAAAVTRLLAPGGVFVCSILHPCFPGVTSVSGSWPPEGRYYDEGWWLADGELSWIRRAVGANHRMLSTYVNTLVDAGLIVDRVLEPPPEDAWANDRPGTDALPVYLVIRARTPVD